MTESPDNNLGNVKAMAMQLRAELDKYTHKQKLADLWLSGLNKKAQKHLEGVYKYWNEQNIKSPPSYIPESEIPTEEYIRRLEDPEDLNKCIDALFNALRFSLLLEDVENELPASDGEKLNIEIVGENVDIVGRVSKTVADAITRILPFGISTCFSTPEGTAGPVHETISFKYVDRYDEELQDAVVRTRIAIIAGYVGFKFDADRMVINID